MPGNVRAPFKYTIPITRAISENDELFLEGEASGPEIDTFGTRIHPDVVSGFAEQIQTRAQMGDPIPYRDTHGQGVTGDQPVMADFGELVAATVTDDHHLRVRVRLDTENPAARFLHKQIERGKRYGMSVGGNVQDFRDEYAKESGRIVRTFTSVILDHIANTSQPSWTPSLGTVLMRAVDRALEGENMDEAVLAPETPAVEGAEEATAEATTEVTAEAVAEVTAEATQETPEETTTEATAEEETATPEVHTIEATALQPVADAITALASAVSTLMATPVPATVAVARSDTNDAARSVPSESPVAGNDEVAVLRTAFESLRTELAQANDRIRQLEAEPAGNQPQVIERTETNVKDELSKMTPHERLLLGLQAAKAANQ